MNYNELNDLYKNNEFRKIDKENNSEKFYLLRSISKAKTINKFCQIYHVERDLNNILSDQNITKDMIIDFIKSKPILKSSEQIKKLKLN